MDPDRLMALPLFAGLSQKDREAVARWADEVEVPEGKHLVDEGRFAYEFFVIEKGSASVVHGGAEVATLGPGDFFGEIGLLQTERRTASVVARSPMRLIVIFAREFQRMAKEMPALADRVRAAMLERGRSLREADREADRPSD